MNGGLVVIGRLLHVHASPDEWDWYIKVDTGKGYEHRTGRSRSREKAKRDMHAAFAELIGGVRDDLSEDTVA